MGIYRYRYFCILQNGALLSVVSRTIDFPKILFFPLPDCLSLVIPFLSNLLFISQFPSQGPDQRSETQ